MSHHKNKQALLQRLKDLGLWMHEIEAELDAPHSKDWDDMAIEREDDEVLERLGVSGQAEVVRITEALKRLARGTYGTCLACGEQIAPERLELVPDAPLCRACAEAAVR